MKNCSICQIPIEENYCTKCGQKYSEKRVSVRNLFIDLIINFISLERSGIATIVKIISNPKPIVDNYMEGFKKYYASPGPILLYGVATVAIHVNFVDRQIMGLSFEIDNFNAQYLFWVTLFPFLLLISYMTFFRLDRRFSKHLVSISYVATSLFILLMVLNDIIILIFGDLLDLWAFYLFVVLTLFWNSRVFSRSNKALFLIINTLIQILLFIGLVALFIWVVGTENT